MSNNKKLRIEELPWYNEFVTLICSQEAERIREKLKKFDESFFFPYFGFDIDLLELVRRECEDMSGNPLKSVLNASELAKEILFRFAYLVHDDTFRKYEKILVKKSGSSQFRLIPWLREEKRKQVEMINFLEKYFPKFA